MNAPFDAYDVGANAFLNGLTCADCPYTPGTTHAHMWASGWGDAEAARTGRLAGRAGLAHDGEGYEGQMLKCYTEGYLQGIHERGLKENQR